MTYKNRILLSNICFIILPVIFLAYFTYNRSSGVIEKQAMTIAKQSLEQVNQNLTSRLTNAQKLSGIVAGNETLREILEKDPKTTPIGEQIDNLRYIERYIDSLLYLKKRQGDGSLVSKDNRKDKRTVPLSQAHPPGSYQRPSILSLTNNILSFLKTAICYLNKNTPNLWGLFFTNYFFI